MYMYTYYYIVLENCYDIPAQLTTKGQTDIRSYMHIMHVYIHNN